MQATKEHEATRTWGYPQVEAALAQALDSKDNLGALRGRIQHLRRLKLTPKSSRGRVISYDFEWCARWHLALLLTTRLRIDPSVAVATINLRWGKPSADPEAAVRGNTAGICDLVTVARGARKQQEHVLVTFDLGAGRIPDVGHTSASVKGVQSFLGWLGAADRMVVVFDLSAAMHRLDAALASANRSDA